MKAIRKSGWLVMAAALMMGFTACSDEDLEPGQDSGKKTYTLTVQATKGGDTRALFIDTNPENDKLRLNATWEVDEQVAVYNKTKGVMLEGNLTAQSAGASTTLSGPITGDVAAGDELELRFLSASYGSHDGTLTGSINSIDKVCDYAVAPVTVATAADGIITTTGTAVFVNQQAVVRFTLKDKANSSNLKATSLRVQADGYDYTISGLTDDTYTTNGSDGVVYVAIPGFESKNVTLTATVGTDTYSFTQNGVTFVNGKFYNIPVYMVKVPSDPMYSTPLTFEAKTAGAVVEFTSTMDPVPTVEYSTDGITWNTYTSGITLASVGDKVSFRGDNATYAVYTSRTYYSKFSCSGDCYIYGNIMSLISSKGYATATTLSGTYTFYRLFSNNYYIYNHPSKTLVLPATTLATSCYSYMFSGCDNLTTAPDLPATTLAESCYDHMFYDCDNLTTAPELPATTLVSRCYQYMFFWCWKLTTAPELPATTLAENCYSYMFDGCDNLTTAPELPATTLARNCYANMFNSCDNLTTAPELPATTMERFCYDYMFSNCTSLTAAPELPATTLAEGCYQNMFSGCTLLEEAPELPATTLADGCYYQMFYDCPNLTTAPELPATTLANTCYYQMFYSCTSLTKAPDLPATTLEYMCYYGMFNGCTNLNSVKCLATDIPIENSTTNWLNGVAATGTFTKASGMEDWPSGINGIPENWSVVNE